MSERHDEHPVAALSAFLDGALGAEERRAVEAHLASCASCRGVLEDLRALAAGVRAIEVPPVPAGLAARIAEALDAERKVVRIAPAWRSLRWRIPAAAAATIAAVGLVAVVWERSERPRDRGPEPTSTVEQPQAVQEAPIPEAQIRSAMDDHRARAAPAPPPAPPPPAPTGEVAAVPQEPASEVAAADELPPPEAPSVPAAADAGAAEEREFAAAPHDEARTAKRQRVAAPTGGIVGGVVGGVVGGAADAQPPGTACASFETRTVNAPGWAGGDVEAASAIVERVVAPLGGRVEPIRARDAVLVEIRTSSWAPFVKALGEAGVKGLDAVEDPSGAVACVRVSIVVGGVGAD